MAHVELDNAGGQQAADRVNLAQDVVVLRVGIGAVKELDADDGDAVLDRGRELVEVIELLHGVLDGPSHQTLHLDRVGARIHHDDRRVGHADPRIFGTRIVNG